MNIHIHIAKYIKSLNVISTNKCITSFEQMINYLCNYDINNIHTRLTNYGKHTAGFIITINDNEERFYIHIKTPNQQIDYGNIIESIIRKEVRTHKLNCLL